MCVCVYKHLVFQLKKLENGSKMNEESLVNVVEKGKTIRMSPTRLLKEVFTSINTPILNVIKSVFINTFPASGFLGFCN